MNRLRFGMLPVFALLLLAGCNGEPTEPLREGVTVVAEPSQLFLSPGQSKTVDVSAEDAQGNPLSFAFEVTEVGQGITVRRDSTFLPVYVDDSTLSVPETGARFRFIVTAAPFTAGGTNFPVSSFKVVVPGDEVTIPVQVAPIGTLDATFDTQTPALGATVTLTAPPGTTFAPDATVAIGEDERLQPVIVSQSESAITFFVAPGTGGPVLVDGVFTASAPGVRLKPTTTLPVTGVSLDSLDVTLSNPTPAIGETVTLTLPPLAKFQVSFDTLGAVEGGSVITFPGQVAAPEAVTLSPDSSSLTFEAPPNAAGPARVDSLVFPGGYTFSLPTRQTITAPSIGTTVDIAFSNPAPAVGEEFTATAPAGFKFTADPEVLAVLFGTAPGGLTAISADSSTLTFVALPGVNAPATVTGLRVASAPQFLITLPSADTLVTPTLTPLPNADDPATAPSLTLPAPGASTSLLDAGPYLASCFGFHSRLYKLTVDAPATIQATVDWYEHQDLAVVLTDATADCDAGTLALGDLGLAGGILGGSPEILVDDDGNPAPQALAPGTYFIHIINFDDPDIPQLIEITLDRAP